MAEITITIPDRLVVRLRAALPEGTSLRQAIRRNLLRTLRRHETLILQRAAQTQLEADMRALLDDIGK
jgi:hypothetical protein